MADFGRLREIATGELELMRTWRNAPAVRSNMYTRHEISLEEHLAWWARISIRADQQYFMYEYAGVPCGIVAFTGIDKASCNSSWAFYAAPDAAKGTGSRMEYLALEQAFEGLHLHKLCCEVLAFNSAVIKLHQKFGFQIEGVLRDQHLVDGKFVDVYRLGILRHEWSDLRPSMAEKIQSFTRVQS